jgi:hypothetical protein
MTNPVTTPPRRVRGAAKLLVGVLLLLPSAFVRAEVNTIAWQEGGRFERTLVVAPGKLVEFCGALRLGQSVTWSFEAEGAMNFNIHYHVGEDVRYPSRRDQVRQAHGVLAVESAQDYCWMWVNKSERPSKLAVALNKK